MSLTRVDAERLADCALRVVQQRYPHKLDHLIRHADDHPLPHAIHPVFDGCYDWHSSVHMHWSLLRLCRAVPELSLAPAIAAHFDAHFTPGNVALRNAIDASARAWFASDRDYPIAYEPGGNDFLSPGLCEALLMREVLGGEFGEWWRSFAPDASALDRWLAPAIVSDRSDAQG